MPTTATAATATARLLNVCFWDRPLQPPAELENREEACAHGIIPPVASSSSALPPALDKLLPPPPALTMTLGVNACTPVMLPSAVLDQIPGGYLSKRVGGKAVLAASFFLWVPASAFTALPSRNPDHVVSGVTACRLAVGGAQGMFLPAVQSVLSHWIPPAHRGRHFAFAMSGMFAGAATAMVTVPVIGEEWKASGFSMLSTGQGWLAEVSLFHVLCSHIFTGVPYPKPEFPGKGRGRRERHENGDLQKCMALIHAFQCGLAYVNGFGCAASLRSEQLIACGIIFGIYSALQLSGAIKALLYKDHPDCTYIFSDVFLAAMGQECCERLRVR